MEHKILHKAKITQIVKEIEKTDNVTINKLEVKPGADKGANFSGEVLSCKVEADVDGSAKSYHWMVKLPAKDPNKLPMNRAMRQEEKEIKVYNTILPAYIKFIQERNADIELSFCPAPYSEFHEINKEDCQLSSMLVMEHMGQHGFADAIDKRKGLPPPVVNKVLEALAKFHAVGHAYFTTYPGGLEKGIKDHEVLTRDYFCADPEPFFKEMMDTFKDGFYTTFYDYLEWSSEPGQDFHNAMKKYIDENGCIVDMRDELYKPVPGAFNTLCHGDPWFNNMVFK